MDNRIGNLCQITGWIIMIAGFFGGIVLGNAYEIVEVGYYGGIRSSTFNVAAMIYTWISVFIMGVLLLGLAEIIQLLERMRQDAKTILSPPEHA